MHEYALLRDLVLLVAVAIPVVVLTHRLKVATVVGFLLTGMLIGPYGLSLISRPDSVASLAELGVVLLLFAIGLELSLARIIKLGRMVVLGGGLQVVATLVATGLVALAFAVPARQAVLLGALAALSSTAIVLKVYTDRAELDTPQGRVLVAILLFQDLCVVPLMLLVPMLGGAGGGARAAAIAIGIALLVTTALVLVGRVAVPRLLERVAALRNREIFTLCIVVFGLGAAYVTASAGLSLALGAFIAGLVISESEYGIQALSDVLPFRDTFSGIFFTSVGMLLDLRFVAGHLALVLGATLGLVVLKALVAGGVVRLLRRSLRVSVISGLALAQVGEFSFVLAAVAAPLGLLTRDSYHLFLGVSVLSMILAPFVIQASVPVADRIMRLRGAVPLAMDAHMAEAAQALSDHVIVVGYGVSGRNLAKVLKGAEIPYVILEQNGQVVRQARLDREPILFGDATRHEVLERVGIARARVIVFAISSPAGERRGVAVARHLNSEIAIVVRTRYVREIEELERLGADQVIPEEFETSLEIFARVLRLYGIPTDTIRREIVAARGEHYEMLRGLSLPGLRLDALRHLGVRASIETVEVEEGTRAVGENPTTLALRRTTGCSVIAVVRDGEALYAPDPDFRFRAGDLVVLAGTGDAMAQALPLFQRPRERRTGAVRLSGIVPLMPPPP